MRNTAKLLCLALALCIALTFGACNKETAAPATTTQLPKDTASIFYLSGARYGEVTYPLSDLDISEDMYQEYYIYFLPDGTGELVISGISYNSFTYADGKLTETITEATADYTITGDSLSLMQDGVTLVFTRGEAPEWLQELVAEPQDMVEEAPESLTEEEAVPAD